MDVHKSKPFHGLRDFLKEYAIIVIGVLTALAAEQSVVWLHDRQAAAEARAAVRAEVAKNLSDMQYRVATQACVEKRLDEIGDLLARTQDGVLSPQPKWVGQP